MSEPKTVITLKISPQRAPKRAPKKAKKSFLQKFLSALVKTTGQQRRKAVKNYKFH